MLPMLLPMLTNVVGGLCADAATNLAKDHVMDMVGKCVPPEAMGMIDQMVSSDPSNPCSSMGELIDCMCDPDNHDVPAMPPMPSMADMPQMCNDMMSGALQDDGMQWANSMMEMSGSMMNAADAAMDTMSGMGEPMEITCKLPMDPSTMDIKIERI